MTSSTPGRRVDPVTVEDDDDDDGDDYKDEARSWKPKMARPVSPPIDNVISSFNEELDQLTKSLDDVLSMQSRAFKTSLSPDENSISYHNRPSPRYNYSSAKKPPLKYVKDPPPSADRVSPLRTFTDSTPSRHRNKPRSTTTTPFAGTPAEPPPAPVRTPSYPLFPTPAATPNRRREERPPEREWEEVLEHMRKTLARQDEIIQDLQRENKELHQKVRQIRDEPYERPVADPSPYRERSSSSYPPAPREEPPSLKRAQDEIIQQLERENKELHHKVRQIRDEPYERPVADPSPYRDHARPVAEPSPYRERSSSSYPPAPREEPPSLKRAYREEPNGRLPTPSSSFFRNTPSRIPSPPRRINTSLAPTTDRMDHPFSPGTKFVAELARLMKMEEGHHAPLSVILDRNWDKLQHYFHEADRDR